MRTFLTILFAATALAGLGAGPAAADDWQTQYKNESGTSTRIGDFTSQTCWTPYRTGNWGQYGAWGNYVDGCTASRRCEFDTCKVYTAVGLLVSHDWDKQSVNSKKTCNVRMRVFDTNGNYMWHRDGSDSSEGTYAWRCRADAGNAWGLRRGQWVTVQANGVRDGMAGSAKVVAYVELVRGGQY